jgi:hypothetical protein
MTRPVRLLALLAVTAAVLALTTIAAGSSGDQRVPATPRTSSAPTGLGSPFASGSGTCDPILGYTTFAAYITAGYSDPLAELTTNGPATLQAYPENVDTGGAGSVWGALGYPLSPGNTVRVQISCAGSPTDVDYTIALYDASPTPLTVSGAATACPSCFSTNEVQFWAPATADYVAHLTLTDGSVDLSNGQSDQVFTSSGDFPLGNFGQRHGAVYLTPLAGPTAIWALSIEALPVTLSGLQFAVPYIRPSQRTTIGYHLDGDVTLSAMIKSGSGAVVQTLATDVAVTAGDHTLEWDGLDASGYPVPDGTYTAALTYTDAAGNPGSGTTSVEVDSTPPVVTPVSLPKSTTANLVLDVRDALSGLGVATLSIDRGKGVQSLTAGESQFAYVPPDWGWSSGKHTWHVSATDNLGNTGSSSGTFTVGPLAPTPCRVPRLIGRTPKQARRAIVEHLCSVGRVSHGRSPDRLRGRVIHQHPRAGRRLREHARVRFRVGLGRGTKQGKR